VRISPDETRKKGRVPKNGSIFFTIFQTFMSGRDAEGNPAPNFGDYPPDFFDFVVIDECPRGGANDESNWRGILEYFAPAVQLGLTATPKHRANADTYANFGDPVYIYSRKQGINDGFLTPFKVNQIATTLDSYVYTAALFDFGLRIGKLASQAHFRRRIGLLRGHKILALLQRRRPRSGEPLAQAHSSPHAPDAGSAQGSKAGALHRLL
jgi:type I restriction enzyme R subunit